MGNRYRRRDDGLLEDLFVIISGSVSLARRAPPAQGFGLGLVLALVLAGLIPLLLTAAGSSLAGPVSMAFRPLFSMAAAAFQVFGFATALLCWGAAALSWFSPKVKRDEVPYIAKPLMTPTEVKFFLRLQEACSEYVVGPQVALAAIVDVPPKYNQAPGKQKYIHRSGFAQKFADFAIIDKQSGQLHAIVELDDYSHDSDEAQEKDARRDAMLKSVGIPVFRFDARRMPTVAELEARFEAESEKLAKEEAEMVARSGNGRRPSAGKGRSG